MTVAMKTMFTKIQTLPSHCDVVGGGRRDAVRVAECLRVQDGQVGSVVVRVTTETRSVGWSAGSTGPTAGSGTEPVLIGEVAGAEVGSVAPVEAVASDAELVGGMLAPTVDESVEMISETLVVTGSEVVGAAVLIEAVVPAAAETANTL